MIRRPHFANPMLNCAITLLLAALVLTGCNAESAQTDAPSPYVHRVTAQTVTAQDSYQIPRRFTGVLKARQSAKLGFELAGKLIAIHVDEGEQVQQGQLLAELDTALLLRSQDELQAQIRETEARLDLVKQNLRRIDDLNKKGFASAREQDELVSQRKVLSATLERLAATLAANTTQLEKSHLLAPFDAVVSRRQADTGAVLAAGAPVLRLLQAGPLEARIGLPPRLLPTLQPGQMVTLFSAEHELTGQIITLNPALNTTTRTVTVRIALPPQAGLVDGDLIDLQLPETVQQAGFWVSLTALNAGLRGLWNLYVLSPTAEPQRYRLEARDVQIEYANLEQAFVSGALADGERIIQAGLHRLTPGQIVRLDATLAQR